MMTVLDNHIKKMEREVTKHIFFPSKWNIKQLTAQSGALTLGQVVMLPRLFIYFWFQICCTQIKKGEKKIYKNGSILFIYFFKSR